MTKLFKNIFIFSFSTGFIPRSLHSRSTRPWITHDGTYESRLVDIKLKNVMNFPGRPGICWSMHIPVSPRSWASTESPRKCVIFFYPKQIENIKDSNLPSSSLETLVSLLLSTATWQKLNFAKNWSKYTLSSFWTLQILTLTDPFIEVFCCIICILIVALTSSLHLQ